MNMNNAFWRLCERFYSTSEPPPRVRTKPMQVLCVGLPRSGTESLQKALIRLGYDYTFHGWDMLFEEPHRMQAWVRLARKKWYGDSDGDCKITAAEFDELLGHSVAVTDAAASCFAAELIAAYPDAKVILNVRDVDKWHASAVQNLGVAINDTWSVWLCWFHPTLWWMYHCHQRMLWSRLFRCTGSSLRSGIEANGKWIYHEHCAMINGLVPKERLLEWNVTDGWEPLCAFLGKEVPKEPFPRTNDAAAFHHRTHDDLDRQGTIAMVNMFVTLVVTLWFLFAVWRLLSWLDPLGNSLLLFHLSKA